MSLNKYKPHLYVIPEDDANRQLADGFKLHEAVNDRTLQVMRPAGGWTAVRDVFVVDYLPLLRNNPNAHVLMLIDFDDDAGRRQHFAEHIPAELQSRVFVLGSWHSPESLKRELGGTFESIGRSLAKECADTTPDLWNHTHLQHNQQDMRQLTKVVKPFLFKQ